MNGGEGGGDTDRDPFEIGRLQRTASGHGLRQGGTVDVLGDQVGRGVAGVHHVENLGRAEPGDPLGEGGLPAEPRPELGDTGEFRSDHLDRDQPVIRSAPQVDRAHTTFAEAAQQHVATQAGRVGGSKRRGQVRGPAGWRG